MTEKKNRLSNSSINRYTTCGESYRLHYIEKIRPTTKSSALVFGIAMDKAINALIEKDPNYLQVFNQAWSFNKIEDDEESISDNINMRYSNSEFDKDLLYEEDVMLLNLKIKELELPENIDIITVKKEKGYDNMSEAEIRLYNLMNWLCIRNKAPYMLEAYKTEVIPRIKKVHHIQKEIKLENDNGDIVTGFADLHIDYLHDDDKIYEVIADNKTSSIKYTPDSVATSQQLAIYCISEHIKHAVYFVIQKKLKKTKRCIECGYNGIKANRSLTTAKSCDNVVLSRRCSGKWENTAPEAKIDIIFDEIDDLNREKILNMVQEVNQDIKDQKFEKNPKSCGNYGGCEYRNLCWQGSMKGLKKHEGS